jgi:hypothetical protein
MSQVPALAQVLRNLGFSWSTADEWTAAIDRCYVQDLGSDDLAAAILKSARDHAGRRLRACRRQALDAGQPVIAAQLGAAALAESASVSDLPGQILMDFPDSEAQKHVAEHGPQQEGF